MVPAVDPPVRRNWHHGLMPLRYMRSLVALALVTASCTTVSANTTVPLVAETAATSGPFAPTGPIIDIVRVDRFERSTPATTPRR